MEVTVPSANASIAENIVAEVTKSVEPSATAPVVIDNVGIGPDALAKVS